MPGNLYQNTLRGSPVNYSDTSRQIYINCLFIETPSSWHDFWDSAFVNTGNAPACKLNPLEVIRKLHDEEMELYERMLKKEDGTVGAVDWENYFLVVFLQIVSA